MSHKFPQILSFFLERLQLKSLEKNHDNFTIKSVQFFSLLYQNFIQNGFGSTLRAKENRKNHFYNLFIFFCNNFEQYTFFFQ